MNGTYPLDVSLLAGFKILDFRARLTDIQAFLGRWVVLLARSGRDNGS